METVKKFFTCYWSLFYFRTLESRFH